MIRFEDYTQVRAISAGFDRRKLRYSKTAVDFQCLTYGIWGRNADVQRISPRAHASGLRSRKRAPLRAHISQLLRLVLQGVLQTGSFGSF